MRRTWLRGEALRWLRRPALAAWLAIAAAAFGGVGLGASTAALARGTVGALQVAPGSLPAIAASELPSAAARTLARIGQGGPFRFYKDGSVFGNRERLLPIMRRGYYREYTVPPSRQRYTRGVARIVCGGPERSTDECYYTDDHYSSFKRIVE